MVGRKNTWASARVLLHWGTLQYPHGACCGRSDSFIIRKLADAPLFRASEMVLKDAHVPGRKQRLRRVRTSVFRVSSSLAAFPTGRPAT